jgi:AraC family transcriptional regulator, regulatory protein of adaptative response / methylated-DNA-[protein]-cysteine methyltransferase
MMTALSQRPQKSVKRFSNDDDRWQSVLKRDRAADGAFVYSVRSTGVYCRPVCSAKLPLRGNVRSSNVRSCGKSRLSTLQTVQAD